MQQTVHKVESKTSSLLRRTQSIKQYLERIATTSAGTAADNRRLRDEAKQHQDSAHHSSSSLNEEVQTLRAEVTRSKAELKDAMDKVATLQEDAEMKEAKNSELKHNNDQLQKENQTLQKHIHEIKTNSPPDTNGQNTSPKTSPSASPLSSPNTSPPVSPTAHTKLNFVRENAQDGASQQPVESSPTLPKSSSMKSRSDAVTPSGGTVVAKGEPGNFRLRFCLLFPLFSFLAFFFPLLFLFFFFLTNLNISGGKLHKNRAAGLTGDQLKSHNIIVVQSVVRRWLGKRWAKRTREFIIFISPHVIIYIFHSRSAPNRSCGDDKHREDIRWLSPDATLSKLILFLLSTVST